MDVLRSGATSSPALAPATFPLWGKAWPHVDVAGVGYRKDVVRRLLGESAIEGGVAIEREAALRSEPANPHDPNAVAVDVAGEHVGYLPAGEASRYREVLGRLEAQGLAPTVTARIWGSTWERWDIDGSGREVPTQEFSCDVRLALDEPHLIVPRNCPPTEPAAELPAGGSVQVTVDAEAVSALAPLCGPHGEGWVYATLHELEQQLARSTRTVIEVRVDGRRVGQMTPKMSEQFLPVVRHLVAAERTTACRALLKGNALKVDVRVHASKSQDLSTTWLAQYPATGPQRSEPDEEAAAPVVRDSLAVASTDRATLRAVEIELVPGANTEIARGAYAIDVTSEDGSASPVLDLTALVLGPGRRVRADSDMVFYNQPTHPGSALRHVAHVGGRDGLQVDLDAIEADVEAIVVAVSAEGRAFREVAGLRISVTRAGGAAVASFAPPPAAGETSFVLLEIYRRGQAWKIRAVGQGYSTGLAGLAGDFGIQIDG